MRRFRTFARIFIYLVGTALSLLTRKITTTSASAARIKPGAPTSSAKPVLGNAVEVGMIVCVETAIWVNAAPTVADGIQTDIYQATLLNKEFLFPLNVVIMLKTNLSSRVQAQVILFSTDLQLEYCKLIDYYSLRFQIEFNFRDAKQYLGLDDFMNVEQTALTHAANLSLFMVNLSHLLLQEFRQSNPEYRLLDLKAHYHGCRYAIEAIKLLPQKPDAVLLSDIFEQIARLGMIHPIF